MFYRNIIAILVLCLVSLSVKAQDIYKTPSGEKYHLGSCRSVKNVSEKITLAQARELGLQPCKICKPPTSYSTPGPRSKAQGQSVTVQCKGQTKAGTRCKHKTSIANGYCFQHQP